MLPWLVMALLAVGGSAVGFVLARRRLAPVSTELVA
jgi:hypothetical protein